MIVGFVVAGSLGDHPAVDQHHATDHHYDKSQREKNKTHGIPLRGTGSRQPYPLGDETNGKKSQKGQLKADDQRRIQ